MTEKNNAASELTNLESHRCFGGIQSRHEHPAQTTACRMKFSVFLPSVAKAHDPVPVIYWLSGLTCSDENFVFKSGMQRYANQHQVAIVVPDTSPRGDNVPDAEDGESDLGHGAGFYLNATQAPWQTHYQMYSYITEELPALIAKHFPIDVERASIMGHSMGGHGALSIALKNPTKYESVSAFSPICAPSQVPWGTKAFTAYLGSDSSAWAEYDTLALLERCETRMPLFIDQGADDPFLETQLKIDKLEESCNRLDHPLKLRVHSGYDHSYFFIASFIEEHIKYHADVLYHH